jgi:hypothetical protein
MSLSTVAATVVQQRVAIQEAMQVMVQETMQ